MRSSHRLPTLLFVFSLLVSCGSQASAEPAEWIPTETSEDAQAISTASGAPTAQDAPTAQPKTAFDPSGLAAGPGQAFQVLDNPRVVGAEAATWLDPDDIVLGVEWNGEARAYPVSQMAYHHIANDQIAGKPFLVTY